MINDKTNKEGELMSWKKYTIRVEWDKESDDVYGLPDELSFQVRMVGNKNRGLGLVPKNYQSQLEKCVLENEKEYESEIISIEEEV